MRRCAPKKLRCSFRASTSPEHLRPGSTQGIAYVSMFTAQRLRSISFHVHKLSATVLAHEDLNEAVSDNFVKRPKFFVRFEHCIGIA